MVSISPLQHTDDPVLATQLLVTCTQDEGTSYAVFTWELYDASNNLVNNGSEFCRDADYTAWDKTDQGMYNYFVAVQASRGKIFTLL